MTNYTLKNHTYLSPVEFLKKTKLDTTLIINSGDELETYEIKDRELSIEFPFTHRFPTDKKDILLNFPHSIDLLFEMASYDDSQEIYAIYSI